MGTSPGPSRFPPLLTCSVLVATLALGCQGQRRGLDPGPGTGGDARGGNGGGQVGVGGTGFAGTGGLGGVDGIGGAPAACTGSSDVRLVVAPQRILRLTHAETLNTVRYLIDDTEATALVSDGVTLPGDDNVDSDRLFPPLQETLILEGSGYVQLDQLGRHVSDYVLAHYATLTMALAGCATETDDCATSYLNKLATRAYRRNLTSPEQVRFTALYQRLRSQTYNGYDVPATVPEATADAVYALLSSPQLLWRTEFGDGAMASPVPGSVPLTEAELATHLSFFLTDQPPDDLLLAAANENTLRTNLAMHVDRLLESTAAKDWLRTIVETYLSINQLPRVVIDTMSFPTFNPTLVADMRTEARMFLDNALWNGQLTDLLLSRTTFLNTNLASNIYQVAPPAGATPTNFAQAMLPAYRRAGLLTNAAFLTSRSRSDGRGLAIARAKAISAAMLCMPTPEPPPDLIIPGSHIPIADEPQTPQQQAATRAAVPLCNACHKQFDPYGLALENYDDLGRWRDSYADLPGMPMIDASANLPAALGGETVVNAVDLAEKLAASPAFTNCMAHMVLQYALADISTAFVELPSPQSPGCATADALDRYNKGSSKTFGALVRATAATPAFVLRKVVQ